MMNWIKVQEYLPPVDGIYEVMGYLHIKPVLAYYNGLGFLVENGEYYAAAVWRKAYCEENKKYGRQN